MQDPSSLKKAQEEVDRVLQGRPPTYEDIKDLKFLTRCINESLRLYPHPLVSCNFSFYYINCGPVFSVADLLDRGTQTY